MTGECINVDMRFSSDLFLLFEVRLGVLDIQYTAPVIISLADLQHVAGVLG
jgi:hypothetical protein